MSLVGLFKPIFLKSIPQGAATQCYVAVHPDVASLSGNYFVDCNVKQPRQDALNQQTATRLWEISEKIAVELT